MKGLTLTTREQARIQVLNGVIERKVSMAEAAELMRVSERHAWRLLATYRKEGAAGVAHGNRGRRPSTATSPETQERVTALAKGRYAGFNHSHLTELLADGRASIWLQSGGSCWRAVFGVPAAAERASATAQGALPPGCWPQRGLTPSAPGRVRGPNAAGLSPMTGRGSPLLLPFFAFRRILGDVPVNLSTIGGGLSTDAGAWGAASPGWRRGAEEPLITVC